MDNLTTTICCRFCKETKEMIGPGSSGKQTMDFSRPCGSIIPWRHLGATLPQTSGLETTNEAGKGEYSSKSCCWSGRVAGKKSISILTTANHPTSGVEQSWRGAGESSWDVSALLKPLERINASVSENWGKE